MRLSIGDGLIHEDDGTDNLALGLDAVLEVARVTNDELGLAGLALALDAIELSVDEVHLVDRGS